jgi:hypothetical protein
VKSECIRDCIGNRPREPSPSQRYSAASNYSHCDHVIGAQGQEADPRQSRTFAEGFGRKPSQRTDYFIAVKTAQTMQQEIQGQRNHAYGQSATPPSLNLCLHARMESFSNAIHRGILSPVIPEILPDPRMSAWGQKRSLKWLAGFQPEVYAKGRFDPKRTLTA